MFDIETRKKFMTDDERLAYMLDYCKKRNWTEEELSLYLYKLEAYYNNREFTKETLEELKQYINLSTDYWLFLQHVNCYGYALGIDLPPQCFKILPDRSFQPGCFYQAISKIILERREDNLLDRMKLDFKVLGIDYREISPADIISPNEWKITYLSSDIGGIPTDYHFLREGKDQSWYHKDGHQFDYPPSNLDDNGNIIYNPEEAYFVNEVNNKKKYKYEKCFCLRYL